MGESTLEEVVWGILLEVADRNGLIEGEDVETGRKRMLKV